MPFSGRYHPFTLSFTNDTAGGYRVEVSESPSGEAEASFVLPDPQADIDAWQSGAFSEQELQDLGTRLFQTIFIGSVENRLRASLARIADKDGLRINLRLHSTPELADLPWELLYDPESARFLARSERTPIVRYLSLNLPPPETLAVGPPLRVLVVLSSPTGVESLDVEKEWLALQDALAPLQAKGLLVLERLPTPSLDDIRSHLLENSVHIFHFVGHGEFDPQTGEGALILVDDEGAAQPELAKDLAGILHNHPSLRLAYLNACEGALASPNNVFSGVAQTLVQQGLPAAVAMSREISDRGAATLARAFYEALAADYPVDAALTQARTALPEGGRGEWATPVLFSRSQENRLFAVTGQDSQNPAATSGITKNLLQAFAYIPVWVWLVAAVAIAIAMGLGARDFLYSTGPSLLSMPISSPIPSPLPTSGVASIAPLDETLLIIADFDNRSGGSINVDPAQRIFNLITDKLPGENPNLRVQQYRLPIKDRDEARRVLKASGATLLIWGWYDQIGAEPIVELDKDRIRLASPKSTEFSLATPESFVIRFTREIPAQAGYTAFFALGMMQFQLGGTKTAQKFFTRAIDTVSETGTNAINPWEALMWRGHIYFRSSEYNFAVDDYSEVINLYPHKEAYFNRGFVYGVQGQYAMAIADYNKAIEIDPNYQRAYIGRCNVYGGQGQHELAIDECSKAIEIDPNDQDAYFNRGNVYGGQGQYELAIADYSKAIKIAPNYEGAYFSRATAYTAQNRYDLAIEDYISVIEIDPNDTGAYLNRGLIYLGQDQYELAVADFSKAIEIDRNYKNAYSSRAAAYRAQSRYELAIADYTKEIEIDPNAAGGYVGRGNVYADEGKFDEAITDYQTSISLSPSAYVYCVLGITHTKIGDFPSAIDALEEGVKSDVQSQHPWCNTALDIARQGTPTP